MSLAWDTTEFAEVTDAVSVDHEGIAITAVIKDTHVIIGWSVNVKGTWPDAEAIAKEGAEGLSRWLRDICDFTPDGSDPPHG